MKLLILSCNTGEGHNSCARAIEEACLAQGGECVVTDALRFVSRGFSRFISGWHVRIYRYAPGLFRVSYRFFERHPGQFGQGSLIRRVLSRGTERLRDFIADGGYDAVLCTHPFSALMLTGVQRKYRLPIRTGFIATDYTCSPSVRENCPDLCFIPHEDLAGEFTCENIPRERIIGAGIPVRDMFSRAADKDAAKALQGIPEGCRHLLVMCGSMGCGPMEKIVAELSKRLDADRRVTVVCGTNEKLRRRLEKRCGGDERFIIRGFVEDISLLMASADLYLTKPGGVSTTEAARKCLPMVLVDAVAGCEEYNSRFFAGHGGAVSGKKPAELAGLSVRLLEDEDARRRMESALAAVGGQDAAGRIYREMARLADKEREPAACK